jgi:integrase/recombinase XerC
VAGGSGEPVGSARLELVSGVALLREEDAVLEAMLEGWAKQQAGRRGLSPKTIGRRQAVVRQFLDHAGEYLFPSPTGCGRRAMRLMRTLR